MGSSDFNRDSEKRVLNLLYVDTETVWRGGQEQLLTLMTGMLDRNHNVWLASPTSALLSQKAAAAGVSVLQFTQRNELSPIGFFKLVGILRKYPFDLIHFNTPHCRRNSGTLPETPGGGCFQTSQFSITFPVECPEIQSLS